MTSVGLLDCDTHFTDHLSALWNPDGVAAALPEVPEVVDVDGQQRLRIGDLVFPSPSGRHIAVVPDPEEQLAPQACTQIGVGNLLFGSDYPHWDTVDPAAWLEVYGGLCSPVDLRANTAAFVPRMAPGAER